MNEMLWIFQGLLALVFLVTGTLKIMRPKEQLVARMGGLKDLSQPVIRICPTCIKKQASRCLSPVIWDAILILLSAQKSL